LGMGPCDFVRHGQTDNPPADYDNIEIRFHLHPAIL